MSNFTFEVQAINYDGLYYQNDQLIFWLPFFDSTYTDHSIFKRDAAAAGGSAAGEIVFNANRNKNVYLGDFNDRIVMPVFTAPASYTKMAWVTKDDNSLTSHLLVSDDASHDVERFRHFSPSGGDFRIQAGHGATHVESDNISIDDDIFTHVAVTYDATLQEMHLYIDGLLVDSATSVPQRTLGNLDLANNWDKYLDDVRLYSVALPAETIASIYRTTKV